jgi:tetratricopeptide (TPR) repeat protein
MARFDKLELESGSSRQPEKEPKKKTAREQVPWLQQAIEERRCGNYENALRLYSRALEDDKSLVNGWLGQVQMLVVLDESVEAELWSRKALELFPGNGDLLAGRAQAMHRSGNTPQALSLSDASLKAIGQSAYRWLVRGELMATAKQETDRHCFDKAAETDKDWLVPLEIARVYLYLGMPSRALEWSRRAVEKAPDRYFPWYVQGETEYELGLEAPAAKSWNRCLELCPNHTEAQQRLSALDQGGWSFSRIWRRLFGNRS